LRYNLQSVRAYLLREDFQRFWQYQSPAWAGRFLDEWCGRVMRSRLEPLKKVARSLRTHRTLLLNWFRAKGTISAGIVEGFNNKAKLAIRKFYGFREYQTIELALYHQLGDLPRQSLPTNSADEAFFKGYVRGAYGVDIPFSAIGDGYTEGLFLRGLGAEARVALRRMYTRHAQDVRSTCTSIFWRFFRGHSGLTVQGWELRGGGGAKARARFRSIG